MIEYLQRHRVVVGCTQVKLLCYVHGGCGACRRVGDGKKVKLVRRKGSPFAKQSKEVVAMLRALGVPVLSVKEGEAEAVCAVLCTMDIAQGCITSDADGEL